MAPTKGKSGPPKGKSGTKSSSKGSSKLSKASSSAKVKKSVPIKTTQQKTKPISHKPAVKKKRVYTDKELGIPALNGIRPAGIAKVRGTKKGKTFVDDGEGMLAILAMVQAEQEGDIESKIMKARHLEEVREAKKAEAERREGLKKAKLEEVKDEVRKGKKDRRRTGKADKAIAETKDAEKPLKKRKKVSFG